MIVDIKNVAGEVVGDIELKDDIFGVKPNISVMHQAFVRQQANARQGTHKAKTRGEVRGTTAKWYRQKGTGRARHGNRKAPIFVGGGKAHGPRPRDYSKKMPRKMRRLALKSALSAKAIEKEIVVLDEISFDTAKTKNVVNLLGNLNITTSAVFLLPESNENIEKSVRNVPSVITLRANYLNVRDLLKHNYIIAPKKSIALIEDFLG